ncbi:MAG: YraN family protein [Solirubrobacterales bacterium]
MTQARIAAGRIAEDFAAEMLARRGLDILERNVRVRYRELGIAGEIDIVAVHGRALVFVEVKAARVGARRGPERPALAVGRAKRVKLRRLARARLASAPRLPRFGSIRFDVVGVELGLDGRILDCEWIRDAF